MFLTNENINLDKEALIDDTGARISYGDLRMDCNLFEKSIIGRQIFLILADKSIETIRLYYACMANKMVVFLLNPESPQEYIQKYVEIYHPQYIFAPKKIPVDSVLGEIQYASDKHVLYKTGFGKTKLYDDLALLLATSGSTGNPKTVRLSYTNLYDNAMAFVDAIDLKMTDRGLLTLPIFYTYGLAILHMHFLVGGTILISEKKLFDPLYENFMLREKVTNWHGVPYVYETFKKIGMFERIPTTLRLLTMGGGRTDVEFHQHMNEVFLKHGVRVYAMYGQTEGATILTKVPDWELLNPPGCIGVACKGMSASLDPKTHELCFRGSSVCLGYALDYRDLEKEDENKGFLRTGDLAEIQTNGMIFLTGRIKRIVKLRGIRINLEDIERDIERIYHTPVACIDYKESLRAFVEKECDNDSVLDWIANQYKVSRRLLFIRQIGELPRNSVGKLDYYYLSTFC